MASYETFAGDWAAGQSFIPGKRKRLNAVAILLNAFVPSLAFALTTGVFGFSVHYEQPHMAWLILALALFISFTSLLMGRCNRRVAGQPMWYTFFGVSFATGALLGAGLGDYLFHSTMEAAYNYQSMSSYPAVNPAKQKGQEIMDAGRVYFSAGSKLDLSKSMSFHNFEEYCIAPIVNGDEELASYDFWAVGTNCCSEGHFRCGEFANLHARSGLRYMEQEKQVSFQAAVQQAEAAYHLKAKHPLFFVWAQDPLAMINTKVATAQHLYLISVAIVFFTNLFAVIVALMGFSRRGGKWMTFY